MRGRAEGLDELEGLGRGSRLRVQQIQLAWRDGERYSSALREESTSRRLAARERPCLVPIRISPFTVHDVHVIMSVRSTEKKLSPAPGKLYNV